MIESILTTRGRITIPKTVRVKLNLNEGDRIRYEFDGDTVRLIPLKPVRRLIGFLQYEGEAKTIEEMQIGITDGATKVH